MAWSVVDNFLYLCLFFVLALFLKKTIPFLQRYIIPNSILAGFIGLILGPSIIGIIPLEFERLGDIIYHLMAIGFISLSLRKVDSEKTWNTVNAGFIIVSGYLVQGVFGFLFSTSWNFFDETVSPLMGLLLPLGFGQGPGQAYSMGAQWQELGFSGGAAIGLSISAAGFAWATIGGIIILNLLVKKKRDEGEIKIPPKKVMVRDFEFSAIDGSTIQLVFIGAIYFGVFALLTLISGLMENLGEFGATFSQVLWGFHFVFGAIIGYAVRGVYNKLQDQGFVKEDYLNNFILQRISGGVFDFMVAASISAVSFAHISDVFVPLLILTLLGGLITYIYLSFVIKRAFSENRLPNLIAMFGMQTGTISTGVALLREIDPAMESGAAENMVLGSGFSIMIGLPLIALLNVPVMGFVSGNSLYYLLFMGGMIIYGIFLGGVLFRRTR